MWKMKNRYYEVVCFTVLTTINLLAISRYPMFSYSLLTVSSKALKQDDVIVNFVSRQTSVLRE